MASRYRTLTALTLTIAVGIWTLATGQASYDLQTLSLAGGVPGQTAALTASVRNAGSQAVTADVVFYRGDPLIGNAVEIGRSSPALPGGTTMSVASLPVPLADGDLFAACIDPGGRLTEINRNDNCATFVASGLQSDLRVDSRDIRISPVGVDPGLPFTASATVRNRLARAANATVRLWAGHPRSPGGRLLGQTAAQIGPGAHTTIAWTVARPEGDANLWISVDNVVPREASPADNLASRNLFLKAFVDTGRNISAADRQSSPAVAGDLFGTGQPALVFTERTPAEARVTVVQVHSDGSTVERWSKVLADGPNGNNYALGAALADLDNDGQPEIVVEAGREESRNPATGVVTGRISVFALDPTGNTKWTASWLLAGRLPCRTMQSRSVPALGDINADGAADVILHEQELVAFDGRNGAEILRKPGLGFCSSDAASAVIDVDADGRNEFIVADRGVHLFDSGGNLRWSRTGTVNDLAVLDTNQDGFPEVVTPIHRAGFQVLDGRTGALRTQANPFAAHASTIAATSIAGNGIPDLIVANNEFVPAVAALRPTLAQIWFQPTPLASSADNPQSVALADLLGHGRPQVLSSSDRRFFGVQDVRDGRYLMYTSIYGGSISADRTPVPVDVDGDGRGEVIVAYGSQSGSSTKQAFEPEYPSVNFLVFGSVHWKKLPVTWNHRYFQSGQVDKRLAFRHDYQPWRTTNTWRQQPVRLLCDIDFDDDVDRSDVDAIFSARGLQVPGGDARDADGDGAVTVNDSRLCALKCTAANCAQITPPARLLSVNPRVGYPGRPLSVIVRTEFLPLQTSGTLATFGPGISVGGAAPGAAGPVSVLDNVTIRAEVVIAPATSGPRTVTISSGAQLASRADAFVVSGVNTPPLVSAGADTHILLPANVALNGSVIDDGQPAGGHLSMQWSKVSGPGRVAFSHPASAATTAAFSASGSYRLRLTADDGNLVSTDDVAVVVRSGNEVPVVSAGPDLSVNLPNAVVLNGLASDDGLPSGGPLMTTWSRTSGPGLVVFATPNAASTTASFTVPGIYVLTLSGSDSQLSASDDVTVRVDPPRPDLISITPPSGATGETLVANITARFTSFTAGVTLASFGAGIAVGGGPPGGFGPVTVTSATTATAHLSISSAAELGPRTVTLRSNAEEASLREAFLVATNTSGGPASVELFVSSRVVAPDGTITVNPRARDRNGRVIDNPSLRWSISISPEGQTVGHAPVLQGLTVRFPALAKRTINHFPDLDPAGEFADGDPTDPNYGKQSGGLYRITAVLAGTSLSGSVRVALLPSGTAAITVKSAAYAQRLAEMSQAAARAIQASDAGAVAEAQRELDSITADPEFSTDVLQGNHLLAPPNGDPVAPEQLTSRGFTAGLDDARFSSTLTSLQSIIRQATTRVQQSSPSTLSQTDLDALDASARAYKTAVSQLSTLRPSALGVVQQAVRLNMLVRLDIPRLLDTIRLKSTEFLNFYRNSAGVAGAQSDAKDLARMANDQKELSVYDLIAHYFSRWTDHGGTAFDNIVELTATATVSLVNVIIVDIINRYFPSGTNIDIVRASSSIDYVCPLYLNTFIGGSGFRWNYHENIVIAVGCIDSQLLRNLLTFARAWASARAGLVVKDYAPLMRLYNRMVSILRNQHRLISPVLAVMLPDDVQPGLEGVYDQQLNFVLGWPRLNQSRIYCVGQVIVWNVYNGTLAAVNSHFLPACGAQADITLF